MSACIRRSQEGEETAGYVDPLASTALGQRMEELVRVHITTHLLDIA